ncbi:flagellar filament capping protein FliD [Enterobacteriaceae bacterium H20N1]|uniref:Flagellar hook-associated protein 2 n=1 Tax=Dryocola boscaweniae TaxID=2925397 RepID=A0A9X2W7H9_9ENTR|nr:flagellar filament capping protein FliD [Dryocola boscaweniae]MCT4700664.1 flagellar filament capping protein FliD [Dryocola boscaweniae]MCT4717922.1 flagellar filament capping protein FliD [Dryocola boscaweniae]
MSDLTSLDPQTLATQLAGYDILAMQTALKKQTSSLQSQQSALTALRTAMTTFRSALTALNKTDNGMLQNTATTNVDGIATVTANSSAQKGSYSIFVEQLASQHQMAYDNLSDADIKNATGTMSITINGESVDIEMDDLESLSDLTSAINNSEDNPGVTASLIRTDGNVSLMFSSDETGAKNVVEIDASKMDGASADKFAAANQEVITQAADAVFRLGDSTKQYTNSSNTLDKLIDGVTIELTKKQEEGDAPLRINVGTDSTATKEQVQSFVDAYNAMRSSLGTLTASGSDGSDRGAFAGDAGIAALDRELNDVLRTQFGGKDMTAFGITADKDGNLTVDSEKLDDALKADPAALTTLFNGNDGLIKKMDKSMDKYLNSTNGLLKGRQETLDRQQSEIDSKTDKINTRYETSYNRYLKQFTQLQSIMTQMNNTMSMFGLA